MEIHSAQLRFTVLVVACHSHSPTCSWFGITCDAAGHVTNLSLSNAGLTGTLHGLYSAAFHNLTWIDLSTDDFVAGPSNNFVGTIPTNISRLLTLTYLDLSNNNLTGAIPYQLISELPRMVSLVLGDNHLTNPEPPANKSSPMSMSRSLEHLSLRNNDLVGTFPQLHQPEDEIPRFIGQRLLRIDTKLTSRASPKVGASRPVI